MDADKQDLIRELFGDIETFLMSTILAITLPKAAEDSRRELLQRIHEYQQVLNQPQEYVNMSGYIQSTDDDSFSSSGSLGEVAKDEPDNLMETVEYENQDALFPEENKELPQEDLNLAYVNPPSASELRAKAIKCGPLQRKDRFMFIDQFRRFWVALHDHHLYFYGNERDNKPQYWISTKEYKACSSPDAIRDAKKKPSCFQLLCPGSKTQQLIARTPKDMEQWVVAINRVRDEPECCPMLDRSSSCTYEDVVDAQKANSQQQPMKMERVCSTLNQDDAIYNDIQDASITENLYDDASGNYGKNSNCNEEIYDDVGPWREKLNKMAL